MGEAVFRGGGVWGGMRRQVGCQEPAGTLWWSGWEMVTGGVRLLLGCRCSEPLPLALVDGLDGRGQPEVDSARPGQQPGMAAKQIRQG